MPLSKNLSKTNLIDHPSRRSVLKGGAALGVAGAAGLWLPKPASAAPKRGGHAVFAVGKASTTDSFDPQVTNGLFMNATRVAVHDTLFEVAFDGQVVPSVAAGAEANDNATEWRVAIKKDVTFHNGKTVGIEDVMNSIALHLGEDSKSPVKTVMKHLESFEAEGDEIVFRLSEPDADWPAVLSEYSLSILPTKDGAADWASGIGCGPYKLMELEPGVKARLEKFENDHRSDRGWFDSVEMAAVNDASARVNAVLTGEAHVIAEVEPVVAKRLESAANVNVVSRTSPGFNLFDMQTQMGAMGDRNVRLALKHAIKREEFVDKILGGYGTVANDQPIGPTYRYHADLEQHTYDPDKARFYLKEAGLDSLDVELSTTDGAFAGAVDAAQLYSESAKDAGINLVTKRVPSDGYWSDVWGKVPFFASYWTGRPTEALIISLAYGTGAGWNATGFASERLDSLVAMARGERDEAKRMELYTEAQMILSEDGPSVIPAFYNVVDAVADTIGVTDTDASTAALDSRYAVSRWWFK